MLNAEQLQTRSRGLGASDAAAAVGLSKWKTPVALYLEKIGETVKPDRADDGPLYWGNKLEDIVAQEYAKRKGVKVRRRRQAVVHKEHEFIFAHLDRVVEGQRKPLECKTSSDFMAGHWGPDGSDDIPDDYMIQVQHQLACMDEEEADLAVLIGNREFRIYPIKRNDRLIQTIVREEVNFWRCVEERTPPPPRTVDDILDLYPVDSGEQLLADEKLVSTHAELMKVRDAYKNLGDHKKALEEIIKIALKDYSELIAPDGQRLATWKAAKPSTFVDWRSMAETLLRRLNVEENKLDDWRRDFTKTKPGSRRFLPKQLKEAT